MSALQKATKWMSLYCRLRDAIEWNRKFRADITEVDPKKLVVKCCTCSKIGCWLFMDAGHFIPKGTRGQSGVRFDERNVHAQCSECNAFNQGKTLEYLDYMVEKYGREVIDDLRRKDKVISKKRVFKLNCIAQCYKEQYLDLLKGF